MNLSVEDVKYVAALSKLTLTDEEIESMRTDLSNIIQSVEKLNQVDTSSVPPTTSILPIENAFREDEVIPSLPTEKLLQNAPRRDEEYILVPRIIE